MNNNIIELGSFKAKIEYDKEDNIFIGTVLDIEDTVAFHSDNYAGLEEAFANTLADYIEMKLKVLDDQKWEKFKNDYSDTDAFIETDWGLIDVNFENAKDVVHGNFKDKNEYLNAQRNRNSRKWFATCYFHNYWVHHFIGRIEKLNKKDGKILFKRIRVCGEYGDGTCFDGKEDHVWMDIKGFKKFKPDDCVAFDAEVYRYLRQNDHVIDYSLRNPEFIEQVEKYSVPTDEELQEQAIEQMVCETCLYNEQCYCGNCINPEYKKQRMEELKAADAAMSEAAS